MDRLAFGLGRRRGRWIVVGVWLVLASVAGMYQPKLTDAVTSDNRLFLPDDAEATDARELLEARFPGGDTTAALVVYRRESGLTATDRSLIEAQAERFGRVPDVREVTPPAGEASISAAGSTAFTTVVLEEGDSRAIETAIGDLRAAANGGRGLVVEVTGAPAVSADALELFSSVDLPLLLGTAGLVLVILLAVYRSVLLAVVPLVVVAIAYTVGAGLVYGLIQAGLTVDGQSASLLVILMFGAGTDYCLLLVARFREELAAGRPEPEAMRVALRRVAPTIVASALTVAAGLLCLLLASLGSFRALGPVCAIGILVMLTACLTLLPALLLMLGARRLRLLRRPERAPGERLIAPLARRVVGRPGLALGGSSALLALCSLGLLASDADTNLLAGFRQETESKRGFALLQASFPEGRLAPVTVVAADLPAAGANGEVERLRQLVAATPGVAAVDAVNLAPDRATARFDAILSADPYSDAGVATVERLRQRLADMDDRILIGGSPAVQLDVRETAGTDLLLIAPVALLVIGGILAAVVRAFVASVLALASVLLSFAGSLGLAVLLLRGLFGQDGLDPTVPVFAFVFLVALGVDYTIFLLGRIREESAGRSTRDAVVRGLTTTAGVITSAGLVLAGTFAVLAAFPIDVMLQLGLIVALGVLVDTFLVRTVLLPAAIALFGERAWWPARRRLTPPPGSPSGART